MILLEKELAADPNNTRRILQCLESCPADQAKKRYYAQMGMDHIRQDGIIENDVIGFSAALARKAVQFAFELHLSEAEEWAKWSLSRFPDSPFVQVDVNYSTITYLYQSERFDEILPYAQGYFDGVKAYHKNGFSSVTMWVSSVGGAHKLTETQVRFILGHAYREMGEKGKAISEFGKVDLKTCGDDLTIPWLRNMEKLAGKKKAVT